MKVKFLIHLILLLNVNSDNLLDCELNSYNRCTKCKDDNKYLDDGKCYTKVENCKFYESEDFCHICKKGCGFDNDGNCVKCDYDNNNNIHCIKEIDNCLTYPERSALISESMRYFEGIKCTKCNEGYGLNEDSSACIKCENDETGKGGKGEGVWDYWGKCHKIIENCLYYYNYGMTYLSTNDFLEDYYEDNYGIGKGKDKTICVSCDYNYILTQDRKKCVKYNSDEEVAPFGQCIKGINGCKEYKDEYTCKKCKIKGQVYDYYIGYILFYYFLDKNECKKCPLYQKSDGKKCFNFCKIFNSNGTCERCEYNYDNDFKIEFNYYLDGNECKKCENNKPSNGIKCLNKILNCKIHKFNDELNKL